MSKKQKKYSAEFKAKVVLELLSRSVPGEMRQNLC